MCKAPEEMKTEGHAEKTVATGSLKQQLNRNNTVCS